MRLGGAITVFAMGGLLAGMWARERRRARRLESSQAASPRAHGAEPLPKKAG
jgi:hypothetical protein